MVAPCFSQGQRRKVKLAVINGGRLSARRCGLSPQVPRKEERKKGTRVTGSPKFLRNGTQAGPRVFRLSRENALKEREGDLGLPVSLPDDSSDVRLTAEPQQ